MIEGGQSEGGVVEDDDLGELYLYRYKMAELGVYVVILKDVLRESAEVVRGMKEMREEMEGVVRVTSQEVVERLGVWIGKMEHLEEIERERNEWYVLADEWKLLRGTKAYGGWSVKELEERIEREKASRKGE